MSTRTKIVASESAPAFVLAMDASWKTIGVALCTAKGPVWTAYFRPPAEPAGKSTRAAFIDGPFMEQITLMLATRPVAPASRADVIVGIETAPAVYAGRGNQAATAGGLGRLRGMLEIEARRISDHPVWLIPTVDEVVKHGKDHGQVARHGWRTWWGYGRAASREALKRHAINVVVGNKWGTHLLDTDRTDLEGPAGDLAEAILMGVGAARHVEQRPSEPARRRTSA